MDSIDFESENFSVDDIKQDGDDIRKRILDTANVNEDNASVNIFKYILHQNSIGLNEISNVDIGYAGSTIDVNGEKLGKRNPYLN